MLILFLWQGLFSFSTPTLQEKRNTIDQFTLSNYNEISCRHLKLNLEVDFTGKSLKGFAEYELLHLSKSQWLQLDMLNLTINKVEVDGKSTEFNIEKNNLDFGELLKIKINDRSQKVRIYYSTNPESDALQWCSSEQTADKIAPYLFTMGQPILTRQWLPCQDTPGQKLTYEATIKVPVGLMALMCAENNPTQPSADGIYHFKMSMPLPTYLISLAACKVTYHKLSAHVGLYCEKSILQDARNYLQDQDIDQIINNGTNLFGPSNYCRTNILFMPVGFPFGGMESPKMIYLTPSIIKKGNTDNSSVLFHEIAHCWGGNPVTNSNWTSFWINEGITVYIERRIIEDVKGKDIADIYWQTGYEDLLEEINYLKSEGMQNMLPLHQTNITDPNDAMTEVAYERGALFFRELEGIVGRDRIDVFFRLFFEKYRYSAINTDAFFQYISHSFKQENLDSFFKKWIYEQELPAIKSKPVSTRLMKIEKIANSISQGAKINQDQFEKLTEEEYLRFIYALSDTLPIERYKTVDSILGFSRTGSREITSAWLVKIIPVNYTAYIHEIKNFLKNATGRRRLVLVIYSKLSKTKAGFQLAEEIFEELRNSYHPVTESSIAKDLKDAGYQYEYQEKLKDDSLKRKKEIELSNSRLNLEIERGKKEKTLRYSFLAIMILVAVFSIFVVRRLRISRKQNAIISLQKTQISSQYHLLEQKNNEVTDSINYAKRIQLTLLAHDDFLVNNIGEHFVFFKPKDIVSGDFYWASRVENTGKKLTHVGLPGDTKNLAFESMTNTVFLAVCDSTGHGVPGAFMSLLNISFLNEAVTERKLLDPHDIFNYVRKRLIESISKNGGKDGMDGILVSITDNKICYAAANNMPVLISGNQVQELEKDKMPVGYGEKEQPFGLHEVKAHRGDILYLYTDGFADQFGGDRGKKYKYKQLNQFLLSIHQLSMEEQKSALEKEFNKWKGELEQVDDVCVIGVRI